ncbi:MAG: hypothetical protein JOZ91_03550 [Candidatus Eremiobacteraeota bacterium]|nr:hypothetical protein [Candidatus Eremiobacteraeota bacterium]MBV8204061.1 hypothetical protein [Candidatus Eremiobacteraeota bacterium]MBV8263486.1 hypothetical protein [Candidatus Eremiobacteraeota bacterium]MBV8339726.1 hypothetical protein [Candidatus Eremiobacteraeota bacterium]MBV8460113.1 hypothetical protein [Candidatus Eremiobacteraeota bacterium]
MQRAVVSPLTLNVLGFAIGSGVAGFALRLVLVPAGLVGRSSSFVLGQGDIGAYVLRALLLALFSAFAGAIIAAVHNEFAKRQG